LSDLPGASLHRESRLARLLKRKGGNSSIGAELPSRKDPAIRRGVVTYISALLAIAAFSAAANFLTDLIVQRQEATARVVNVSGRQRMLSQRIAVLTLQLADGSRFDSETNTREALLACIARMALVNQAIQHGSAELRLPPPPVSVRAIYYGSGTPGLLASQMDEFLAHALKIVSLPSGTLTMDNPDLAAIQIAARGRLLDALNAAVAAYQQDSETAIEWLHRIMVYLTIALMLVLAGEGFFLYRPLFTRLGALQEELRQAGRTDPLTGCLNRRAFAAEAGIVFARARRYGSPVAVMMVDADHFKQINDVHGHPVGDLVICALAGVLLRSIREVDVLGRMGGEEFAILLPESEMVAAMLVAQRIRKAVAAERVRARVVEGSVTPAVSATVSIGVAILRDTDLSIFDALDRADRALYLAKENGRDRVESEAGAPILV
jgi:diguanylate cyclase (GGDEF)-like protein